MQGWELRVLSHCILQQATPQTSPILTPFLLQLLATGPPSIPAPLLQGQTPWEDLRSWRETLGVTPILPPQGCGQAAPIPVPGHTSCSAQVWLCRWAHPQLCCRSTPVLATCREYQHHGEPTGDMRVDSARGHEDGQCPGMDRRMDEAQGPGAGWCPAHRHGRPSVCTAFKTSPEGKSPAGRIYMSRKGAALGAAALPFLGTGAGLVGAAAVSAESTGWMFAYPGH